MQRPIPMWVAVVVIAVVVVVIIGVILVWRSRIPAPTVGERPEGTMGPPPEVRRQMGEMMRRMGQSSAPVRPPFQPRPPQAPQGR